MYKKVSSVLAVITVLVLLAMTSITVFAQEGSPNPEAGGVASEPFVGSGELATGSAAMAGPEKNPPPMAADASAESVIGVDSRVKVTATTVYPNRAIASLILTFPNAAQYICTGWFIGPNDVATAAHCIYSAADGGYVTSIVVYPGRNGVSTPYGSTSMQAGKRWVPGGWITSGASPVYDYGVFHTVSAMGNTVGWFGFHWQSSNSFPGSFTVRGYPGDKPSGTLWTMNGGITHVSASRLWYNIDTYGGQSGSPLYQKINNVCCYGFGFHTYGTSVSPYVGNSATRINHTVFNNMVTWRNAP